MALTLPTLNAGHVVTAADYTTLMNAISQAYGTRLVVAADNSVNNASTGTTLVDIPNMSMSVAANTTYHFDGVWFYSASTAGDFKCAMSVPASATALWEGGSALSSDTAAGGSMFNAAFIESSTATFGGTGTATKMIARVSGTLVTVGTAGTFKFQMAQSTADAGNTTIYAKSYLIVTAD